MKIRIDEVPGKFFFVVDHTPEQVSAEEIVYGVTFDSPYYLELLSNPWVNDFSYLFEPLNAYWASLSGEAQDAIMRIYVGIFDALNKAAAEPHQLTDVVPALVGELHAYNSVDNIRAWMRTLPLWSQADRYNEQFDQHPRIGEIEQTYLREDYLQLVALTIALKTLMPVWHLYMKKAQEVVGLILPEVNTFHRLMAGSSLSKSAAMQKLQTYIQEFVLHYPSKAEASVVELNYQDATQVLQARVCMRFLVTRMVSQVYTNNLVMDLNEYLHSAVTSKTRS